MFIFFRLLLAHFLGDFPFQFNIIFKLKTSGLKGIVPHALIIFFCSLALSWPYLHLPQLWFFLLFLAAAHLLQDSIKLRYGAAKHCFWAYILDQISHVGIISLVFLTDLKQLTPPAAGHNLIIRLYSNDQLVIYLIALIFATYNGYFLIRCFKDNFLERASYNAFEKWFGIAERAIIVSFFFIRSSFCFLLPVSLLLRPAIFALCNKKLKIHKDFMTLRELILSWIIAVVSGLIFSLL
ncbi:MAG: DUF3307 domain-containing protein [Candidatus Omnitrophota bacterium]